MIDKVEVPGMRIQSRGVTKDNLAEFLKLNGPAQAPGRRVIGRTVRFCVRVVFKPVPQARSIASLEGGAPLLEVIKLSVSFRSAAGTRWGIFGPSSGGNRRAPRM